MVPHQRWPGCVAGRIHYAWIVVAVMFTVILATCGVRAAPGVLHRAAGAGVRLERRNNLRRDLAEHPAGRPGRAVRRRADPDASASRGTVLVSLVLAGWRARAARPSRRGRGSSTPPGACWSASARAPAWSAWRPRWQTAGSSRVAAWWSGLLTASNASGQLVFLPAAGEPRRASSAGRACPWPCSAGDSGAGPVVALLLAESPGSVGLGPYGAAAEPPIVPSAANPFRGRAVAAWPRRALAGFLAAVPAASRCAASPPTGWSATHLIAVLHGPRHPRGHAPPACSPRSGVFDLIGTTLLRLADRPLQSARPAVLVLRPARAVADGAAVHQLRHGQPVGLRGVLRAGLGGDGAAHRRADQRGVRQARTRR